MRRGLSCRQTHTQPLRSPPRPACVLFPLQVYRAWIRELHHLGEKDPITFSHFVRWVVQQEPAAMHRPWQPFSETCRFGHVKYSFIGRAEQPVKRKRDFGKSICR